MAARGKMWHSLLGWTLAHYWKTISTQTASNLKTTCHSGLRAGNSMNRSSSILRGGSLTDNHGGISCIDCKKAWRLLQARKKVWWMI
eukprot:scaffold99897_cov18-Tisochrysis_lutea.AAC.1